MTFMDITTAITTRMTWNPVFHVAPSQKKRTVDFAGDVGFYIITVAMDMGQLSYSSFCDNFLGSLNF